MRANVHLISGLPRSGSTLLSALLRQNPRFAAGVSSPVSMLCSSLLHSMSGATEFAPFFTDERRLAILRGVFESYYGGLGADRVVFDTSRHWTAKTALLVALYPQARIICCVREVAWVIDSVERLVRRNALQPSKIFNYKTGGSIYSRVETLMDPEKGLIGLPWSSLREAWFSETADRLVVVCYERLTQSPEEVLRKLYAALGERWFPHDFQNISYEAPDYDALLGTPGLHQVRSKVDYQARETCLPPDLGAKYSDVNFWTKPKSNIRNVLIL